MSRHTPRQLPASFHIAAVAAPGIAVGIAIGAIVIQGVGEEGSVPTGTCDGVRGWQGVAELGPA